MNTNTIAKEYVDSHSEEVVLAYCTSELVNRRTLALRELSAKNYEKAAGILAEATLALALLEALNEKKNGTKKSVTVA
jgi:hypothetical protein